jgi:hypothetical protein
MNYPINTSLYYPAKKPDANYHKALTPPPFFQFIISEYNPTIFCELGCFTGGGVKHVLSIKKDLFVCAVDTWDNEVFLSGLEPQHTKIRQDVEQNSLYDAFLANIWAYKEQVLPLKMDSIDGVKKIKELGIYPDLIYIDSSHQYQHTKNELNTIDDLFPDCVICGDDYSNNYKGVIQAVDEFVKSKNYNTTIIDGRFIIKK